MAIRLFFFIMVGMVVWPVGLRRLQSIEGPSIVEGTTSARGVSASDLSALTVGGFEVARSAASAARSAGTTSWNASATGASAAAIAAATVSSATRTADVTGLAGPAARPATSAADAHVVAFAEGVRQGWIFLFRLDVGGDYPIDCDVTSKHDDGAGVDLFKVALRISKGDHLDSKSPRKPIDVGIPFLEPVLAVVGHDVDSDHAFGDGRRDAATVGPVVWYRISSLPESHAELIFVDPELGFIFAAFAVVVDLSQGLESTVEDEDLIPTDIDSFSPRDDQR